uniref:beta strand repeat-containing protein n=2 Tax=Olleya namhaensis TaxID=1144750 RepID=UPI00232D2F4B
MKTSNRLMKSKTAYLKLLFAFIFLLSSITVSYAQITGAWSQNGPGGTWQAQADAIYVRIISTNNVVINGPDTLGCSGAYSDAGVNNNASLNFLFDIDGTGALNGSITVGYFTGISSTTLANVSDPIMHLDRVGGSVGNNTNSGLYSLNSGSWTELSQNDVHFQSTATTFNRRIETLATNSTSECDSASIGTAAGSVQLNGVYTQFDISGTQLGPNGGDVFEFVFSGIKYAIDAVDDTNDSSIVEGVGGVALNNVLSNDTLNLTDVTTGNVNLSQLSTTNPGVTLNATTGAVNVASSVPSGVYMLEYQICETANSTNCNTAFAIVTVLPDFDGDGVDDASDLDDDNDGILDTNEGGCTTQIQSGVWNITSGSTASYDFGNGVIAKVTTTNGLNLTAGNFTNQSFWTDALANDASLQSSFVWGSTLTVNYEDSLGNPITVTNPIVHLDRLGGTDGASTQNGAIVTLQDGLTWTEISTTSTDDFSVTSNTASDAGINGSADVGHTQESTQLDTDGTAAGSLQINGEVSTFTIEFVQGGLFGTGTDGIELILSACQSRDTDGDNTPDYLDNDSDGDMCPDAIEGGATLNSTNVDANGQLTGTVDSTTGVPNDVDVNAGQTVGDSTNDFVNACQGNLTGVVFEDTNNNGVQDVDEEGIADVEVTITDVNGDETIVTTGTDGSWTAVGLPLGDAEVDVDEATLPSDITDTLTTTGSDQETVTVIGATSTSTTDDGYAPAPGSVSGTVVDENGDPVSGIVVTLDDGDAATVDPTVTTGVDGTYEFTDVPVGDYTIVETVPANTDVVDGDTTDDGDTVANTDTTDGSIPVTVTAGEVDADNNFENSPAPGSVSGTVVDENGDPVSGIVVTLDDGDAATVDPTVTTGVDGTYEFTDVPVGDYTIVETVPANTDVVDGDTTDDGDTVANTDTTDGSIPVTVTAGEVDADNNFENSPAPGSVIGTVVDENGDPVSGIVVTLDDGDAATVDPTVTTGVDGTYEFTDVPVGDYTIVETVPANTDVVDGDTTDDGDTVANTDTTDGSIPVTVTAGEVDADNNFENSPAPGSVSGTVVDENGDPVSGIVVTLDDGDAATVDPTATTGVDGTYEFTDVPVGDYTIVETVPANTDVVDGDTTDDGDTVANTDTTDGSIPVTVTAGEVDADNNFENSP